MAKKVVSPFLPLAQKHAKELKMNLTELSVAALRSLFAHVYYIWRTYKPELKPEKALEVYGSVWDALAVASFNEGMATLGLKEIKDLPTFGKIVEYCFTGVPALYETKRNEKNEHVGHVLWCANPGYGPTDATFNRHDYYRQEVFLTYQYLRTLIKEAKKVGLKDDVEIDQPSGRCRDGAACACEIVLRTPRADKDRPLPEVKYRFLEEEMGNTEPLLYVLKKQKRSLEQQGPSSFIGFFYVDYLAWAGLENALPAKRALDIYKKLWRNFPHQWVQDARLDLGLGKPKTAKELADILAYCQRKKYVMYNGGDKKGETISLTAHMDPFVEVLSAFGFKKGCSYFSALAEMDQDFVDQVVKEAGLEKRFKATLKKAISKGNSASQIVVAKR
jgi:hypothetical protein